MLTNLNKIAGFFEKGFECDVLNMILSITRWSIWKGRCSKKYGELSATNSIVFELRHTIAKHTQMLLNSKLILLDHTIHQLRVVLDFLANDKV